jgi:hypothetical protein
MDTVTDGIKSIGNTTKSSLNTQNNNNNIFTGIRIIHPNRKNLQSHTNNNPLPTATAASNMIVSPIRAKDFV